MLLFFLMSEKRLNVEDSNVFDTWRELYSELTDAEQSQFYDDIEAKWPWQQHFHPEWFSKAFEDGRLVSVLEVGGWKGELASQMLAKFSNITSWHNIELCKKATDKTVPMSRLVYTFENPTAFTWFKEPRTKDADIFISAHTIEHFIDSDLWDLLTWASGIRLICLEAPISFHQNDWKGYGGTHILKAGWAEIISFMDNLGYDSEMVSVHCFFFHKRS